MAFMVNPIEKFYRVIVKDTYIPFRLFCKQFRFLTEKVKSDMIVHNDYQNLKNCRDAGLIEGELVREGGHLFNTM